MGPDSVVLPLLNGLRHIESLQARFGDANVWGGVCYIGAALDHESGEIRHFGEFHRIIFGELDGSTSVRANAFAAKLSRATRKKRPGGAQRLWRRYGSAGKHGRQRRHHCTL